VFNPVPGFQANLRLSKGPEPHPPPLRRLVVGVLLVALGSVLQLGSASQPEGVERLYSRFLFPAVQVALGCLTGRVPFSVGELLLLAFVVISLAFLIRTLVRPVPFGRRLLSLLAEATLLAGIVYCGFLLLWGLNYGRKSFGTSARLDTSPASLDELEGLSRTLVEETNGERALVREDTAGVMRLGGGRAEALGRAALGFDEAERLYPFLAGRCTRPKPLLLSPLASRLGITGIYLPFSGEANVNDTVPDPDVPFSTSHEIAHQRGFAREDEANYLGYLACRLHPDPDFRYSGLLNASIYVQHALHRARRDAAADIEKIRSPGVRRDLLALQAWSDRYRGPAREAAERVNDAYLKTQGQAAGVESYGRVVDLLVAERRAGSEGGHPAR
jgi:Protein of unknown function (DUF3810)